MLYTHAEIMNNSIKVSFLNGITVDISGEDKCEYFLSFFDGNKQCVYQTNISTNMWASVPLKYYDRWKVKVSVKDKLILEKVNDLKNKRVKISMQFCSIQDVLSAIDLVDRFQKYHECVVNCIVQDLSLIHI